MPIDPNMKCVCGFRKFRETTRTVGATVERWVRFDAGGGLGSTPLGTGFGSASISWGLFEMEVARPTRFVNCENCGRTRSSAVLGGVGVFGAYELGGYVFAVVTDVTQLACLRMRFTGASETHTVGITVYSGTPMPIELADPEVVAASPGAGAVAGVIYAAFPTVSVTGTYDVTLVDLCAGTEVDLLSVSMVSAVAGDFVLTEAGDIILTEDGEGILLE